MAEAEPTSENNPLLDFETLAIHLLLFKTTPALFTLFVHNMFLYTNSNNRAIKINSDIKSEN